MDDQLEEGGRGVSFSGRTTGGGTFFAASLTVLFRILLFFPPASFSTLEFYLWRKGPMIICYVILFISRLKVRKEPIIINVF